MKAVCAPDPIASQKLADVDRETNMEVDNKAAADGFYRAVANWIQSHADTLNPATIFNQCFDSLASSWKFQGKTLKPKDLGKAVQRTQGVKGFYYNVVDKKAYEDMFAGVPNAPALAYSMWLEDAKTDPLKHVQKGELLPDGKSGTWFTPDSYKLTNAADAGFGQLLELAALQPEWFPDGNVVFSVDVNVAASKLVARKPTAYDGMQSALWVSRPGPDAFGVTGGGANEFLMGQVSRAAIKNARLVVPSPALQQELKDAIQSARDTALAQDPELKKAIDAAPDEGAKKQLSAVVPNLTDMFLRGAATMPLTAHVRELLAQIKKVTDEQRKSPSKPRAPGEIVAPSVAATAATAATSTSSTTAATSTSSTNPGKAGAGKTPPKA